MRFARVPRSGQGHLMAPPNRTGHQAGNRAGRIFRKPGTIFTLVNDPAHLRTGQDQSFWHVRIESGGTRNVEDEIGTQQAMLTCKTADELRQVQSDFYERALKDYRVQASRMMELISATSQANGLGAAAKTRRGYDDVPL